jgi:hypothetical protein
MEFFGGPELPKLRQEISATLAVREVMRKGYRAQRIQRDDGRLQIVAVKA